MQQYDVAQINIGRIVAPLDDPQMAGFVSRLDELNALADRAPGFVWRLQTSEGNATYFRPYNDDRILMNMSVWESVEAFWGITCIAPCTPNCCGSGTSGSRSSPERIWRCGGFQPDTFPASTKPRRGSPISKLMAQPSLRSLSKPSFRPMSPFRERSTGHRFSRVQQRSS